MEDLEKAAKEQGVSFEDFKANIRNQIITQLVMRQEMGKRVQFTPGEAQRYFEQHKQEYAQQESVTPGGDSGEHRDAGPVGDGARRNAAGGSGGAGGGAGQGQRHRGQTARRRRLQPTGAQLQRRAHGRRRAAIWASSTAEQLAKVLEDKTFALKAGEYTEPIRTRQGFVILKVVEHIAGGIPQYKDVQEQVEENFFMARMEPAMRAYLTTMREQAYIDIKPGYTDTGASAKQTKPIYSAYVPPTPKKKKKVERTRFRESTHSFRQKPSKAASAEAAPPSKLQRRQSRRRRAGRARELSRPR